MFIFARCLRSSTVVTPAKYELDIIQITIVFIIPNIWEDNGVEKIGLVTPPQIGVVLPSPFGLGDIKSTELVH